MTTPTRSTTHSLLVSAARSLSQAEAEGRADLDLGLLGWLRHLSLGAANLAAAVEGAERNHAREVDVELIADELTGWAWCDVRGELVEPGITGPEDDHADCIDGTHRPVTMTVPVIR